MSRRLVGVVVAVILAAIGTVALVVFVRNAEERARAGEELVEVYVVDQPIAAGTAGDGLTDLVRVELVPAKIQALDSVDSLAALAGQVAAVDLVPGEQLVSSRFVARSDYSNREAGVVVPDDLIEVTVELDPQQAIGGLLQPGETVAVFASFEPFDVAAAVIEVDGQEVELPELVTQDSDAQTPNTTGIILRKILVTAVQEQQRAGYVGSDDAEVDELTVSPEGAVLVTLALAPADAERLVFTQEFGSVWLAVERSTVPDGGTEVQDRSTVYGTAS